MGQVYQHLYGGKAGSPYLFCWVREEDTRPGGWPSLEDPAPRGRGQRAGILNRGARIQRRLWLRGPKAQETLYSLLQSDGSRLADMLFFPVPREALTSLVIFCVVLCGLWALLLSGGRRNGRRTLFLLWFKTGGPQLETPLLPPGLTPPALEGGSENWRGRRALQHSFGNATERVKSNQSKTPSQLLSSRTQEGPGHRQPYLSPLAAPQPCGLLALFLDTRQAPPLACCPLCLAPFPRYLPALPASGPCTRVPLVR